MNGKRIYEHLTIYGYWEFEDMPSVFLIVSVLENMPVSSVSFIRENKRMQVMFSEDLSVKDRYLLNFMLHPDELFYSKEDNMIDLWWD